MQKTPKSRDALFSGDQIGFSFMCFQMLTPFIRRMQSSRDELFLPVAVGPARPRNASASRAGGPCEFYEAADRKDRRPWSRGRRPDVIDDDNVAASRTIDDAILTQPPPPRPRRADRC